MKYTVTITLTAEQVIEVEASDEFEAKRIAERQFNLDDADILDSDTDIEELEEVHAPDCPAVDGFGCRCKE